MSNPADLDDVIAIYPGTMTDDQKRVATALLADGWEQIIARVPGVEARLDGGSLRPGLVVGVLRRAVVAAVRNLGGYVEESIDDWSGKRGDADSPGLLDLTDDDLSPLLSSELAGAAFEITPGCG